MIRAAVLGADVSKSRSPDIHQAAFAALGVEGTYEAFSVDAAGFDAKVTALRAAGYRYLNVTIPHKGLAARAADVVSTAVEVAGAANTLIFDSKVGTRAENTDGPGLLAALADAGFQAAGAVVVMVGAGGAAAGAVESLTAKGATVRMVARRLDAARALRARLADRNLSVSEWKSGLSAALLGATALVSAVPANAWEDAEYRRGLSALERGAVVLEMAYGGSSPLAEAVEARSVYQDGLGMLVHQAAHAIELALGQSPPVAEMFRAVGRSRPLS